MQICNFGLWVIFHIFLKLCIRIVSHFCKSEYLTDFFYCIYLWIYVLFSACTAAFIFRYFFHACVSVSTGQGHPAMFN